MNISIIDKVLDHWFSGKFVRDLFVSAIGFAAGLLQYAADVIGKGIYIGLVGSVAFYVFASLYRFIR